MLRTDLVTSNALVDEFARRMQARQALMRLPFMRRGAHSHHHGIVRAEFRVNGGLEPDLCHGIFAEPRSYPAYVRFSNSGTDPDGIPDARGMAIKVMSVDGEKLLDDEQRTQDFLLVNFPVFIAKDPQEFHAFLVASRELKETQMKDPASFPARFKAFKEAFPLFEQARSVIGNPLRVAYFSQTAYASGDAAIVKYCARPTTADTTRPSEKEAAALGPEYLRAAMKDTLDREDVVFDFMVQRKVGNMPVEDPTIPWEESESHFTKVATIVIAKQVFDSEKQMDFAEDISYNPWHSLHAHKPLGAMNEARRDAYLALLKLRSTGKPAPLPEPTGTETFE